MALKGFVYSQVATRWGRSCLFRPFFDTVLQLVVVNRVQTVGLKGELVTQVFEYCARGCVNRECI